MNHAHFPFQPSLTLLFVAWMSSYERGVQLILEPQQAEKCVSGLPHSGEAQSQRSISDPHRIYFRPICDQISCRDWILVTWMLHVCPCFSEENSFVLGLVQESDAISHMREDNVFSWSSCLYKTIKRVPYNQAISLLSSQMLWFFNKNVSWFIWWVEHSMKQITFWYWIQLLEGTNVLEKMDSKRSVSKASHLFSAP